MLLRTPKVSIHNNDALTIERKGHRKVCHRGGLTFTRHTGCNTQAADRSINACKAEVGSQSTIALNNRRERFLSGNQAKTFLGNTWNSAKCRQTQTALYIFRRVDPVIQVFLKQCKTDRKEQCQQDAESDVLQLLWADWCSGNR